MQFCLVFFSFKWHNVGQGMSVLFSAYFREEDTCCTCMSGPTAITIAQLTTRIRVSCCRMTLHRTKDENRLLQDDPVQNTEAGFLKKLS
jgi:hypothetical protein